VKKLIIITLLLISNLTKAESKCGLNTFGGGEIFPWELAQPFLWSNIQGLWKVTDGSNTILKFKVTRSDISSKKLTVEIYNPIFGKCDKPVMTGIGLINADEKNIVRIILKDSSGNNNKLFTLAWFNLEKLNITGDANCKPDVLIASMINLTDSSSSTDYLSESSEAPKMMLKKITGALDFYCKKRK
jgi:hypothetical protein